jgi:hypothetical protein
MSSNTDGKKVKSSLDWSTSPGSGSVELAPAVDPDPLVSRIRVNGFVPGLATVRASDARTTLSAARTVHVVPWLYRAVVTGTRIGEETLSPPFVPGVCPMSAQFWGELGVEFPGPVPGDATKWFHWTGQDGWFTVGGPPQCQPGTSHGVYPNLFIWNREFLTITGSTVTSRSETTQTECYQLQELTGTFDDNSMDGTLTDHVQCNNFITQPGVSWWIDTTIPLHLGAVAVKP